MAHKLWGKSGLMRRLPAADKNEILERSGGEFGSYLGDKPEEFALFRPIRPTFAAKTLKSMTNPILPRRTHFTFFR